MTLENKIAEKVQKFINELSGFQFEVVSSAISSLVIKTNKTHVLISISNDGDYILQRCRYDGSELVLSHYVYKTYRTMKSVNNWIIKNCVDTTEKQEITPVATPAPVVEESNETKTMQVTHENGEIVITSQSGERLAVSTDDTGKLNVKFLGIDEGKKVAKVDCIKVEWTEAPLEQDTFKSAKELDDAMESILNSPDCDLPDRCYYKTKVTVHFDDGESWKDIISYTKSGKLSDSRLVKSFEYYQKAYAKMNEKPKCLSQEQFDYRIDFYANRSIV